ncbi:MAG: bifunctional biotin--[acetyl-CoA-carboxylase] ligase/biotin operon repressor BirA [Cellvibrionaceae bacterium]
MESSHKILKLLADGDFHSGEELGELLGVSRAAVWKQLKKLGEIGVHVESIKGRGYCIEGGMDLLSQDAITKSLSDQAKTLCSVLECHWSIPSTNAHLLDFDRGQPASGRVCLAEMQTAGRGRRGRSWVSPFAANLYLSVQWGFSGGVAQVEGLSLAVGLALVKALECHGVKELQLKWPNDVLWDDKKLAGVLLEVVGDPTGMCYVVIGVGVNVAMRLDDAEDIDQAWVNAEAAAGKVVSRNALVATFLNELLPLLEGFGERGFTAYADEWMRYDCFRDQPVSVVAVGNKTDGVARGVSATGALLLEDLSTGSIKQVHGGEVSLRLRS